MRGYRPLAMVGALVVALSGAPVMAAPPQGVVIEVDVSVSPEGESVGRFTATGPVCLSGQTKDLTTRVAGLQSERRLQLLVHREFTCDDGTGTFLLLVRVHGQFDEPGSDVFVHPLPKSWSVLDGTGAFESLHGAGEGLGVSTDHGFSDTLTGKMHVAPERSDRVQS